MDETGSRIGGFYRLPMQERRALLGARPGLKPETVAFLGGEGRLSDAVADHMVENCVGTFDLPLGVGLNLRVNGVDRLVPMAVEEPSVVAGLSNAARLVRQGQGVRASADAAEMIGQVQVLDVPDLQAAGVAVEGARDELLAAANAVDPVLVRLGGGARDLSVRILEPAGPDDPEPAMLVVHLVVDVVDAMGANAVNTMAEHLAPRIGALTGGRVLLRILSNLAERRLARAEARVPVALLDPAGDPTTGRAIARDIQAASVFAERDPYRAATHNKGIMNGVDAALIAFGQDFRAVEAGAHAYAARSGRYAALSRWRVEAEHLRGELCLPLAVGTVGGVVRDHPAVAAALDLAGVRSARDLATLVVAVGLVQNLAALRALATEGIQRGHMRLHARKLALSVGARAQEVDAVCEAICEHGVYDLDHAREALERLRGGAGPRDG